MATDTKNPYVDALAAETPWADGLNLKVFFEGGAGGAWTTQETNLFVGAFLSWAQVANVGFTIIQKKEDAHLVERKEADSAWPGDDTPPNADHDGPVKASVGRYNSSKEQWTTSDLVVGGTVHSTFVHELGHALGLDHPHPDLGADALNFPGVTASDDKGDNDLNQRLYSVMSYVRDSDPDDHNRGHVATPMAFDIAAIQQMYGANMGTGSGDTVYTLNGSNDVGNYYQCIWDVSGTDWMVWDGNLAATIDLRPATLRNEAGGGGFLSQVRGRDGVLLDGGFTIAADFTNALANSGTETGVIIENARGGGGNDTIRGNNASNGLYGNGGSDTLEGFDGHDVLDQGYGGGGMYGGNGQDTLIAGDGADHIDGGNDIDTANYSRSTNDVFIDTTIGKVLGGWAQGDTLVNIERVVGSVHDDSIGLDGGDNVIWGGGGHDRLDGRSGIDTLYGEWGNDTLNGGHGRQVGDLYYAGDWIDGGEGWDIATFSSAVAINLATGAHGGEAREDTFISIEQFNGSADADTFVASNAARAYFVGGDGADTFYGGSQDDWFQGGKGRDHIDGGSGGDTVSYADTPHAITAEMYFTDGTTDGKITAGEWGLDTLVNIENVEGTNFADTLLGDERSNQLSGGGGDDRIEGDAGGTPQGSYDYLSGNAGNDQITIGAYDTANGGADHDTATFVGNSINLNFNTNTFSIDGQGIYLAEFETYVGLGASDTVVGAAHGEHINLGNGNDFAYGMNGNDFIWASEGADTMDGGAGYDTIVFHKAMVADWQSGVLDADIASDPWASWEAIQGSAGADRIRTNSWGFAVELRGGGGNDVLATGVAGVVSDTLRGEAGDDQLDGGAGGDLMEGGADNDTYFVDSLLDKVVEAANQGNDTVVTSTSFALSGSSSIETVQITSSAATAAISLVGNAVSNKLYGNAAGNTLNGAGGADILRGFAGNDLYLVDNAGDVIAETAGQGIDTAMASASYSLGTGVSVETLKTTSVAATTVLSLSGNEFVNTLEGNAGVNTLNGRGGADVMRGFAGNDVYHVDNALDNVIEAGGQGIDTVMTTVTYVIGSGASVETLRAAAPAATTAINLSGNASANTLVGNAGNNVLNGRAGSDTMYGLGGNDAYIVDSTADKIAETAGKGTDNVNTSISYQLGAGVSVETLRTVNAAATTAINLSGNELANAIIGNAGSNILNGRAGKDAMTGGGGNDFFAFNTALSAASNVDTILDFNVAQDTIRLENSIFTALGAGPFTAGMFNKGAAATQADDRIVYNSSTGALIYDSNGNAAGGATQFATLSKSLALTHLDFQII